MSTVDKAFADKLVALNGQFEDDPQITSIIEYENAWDGTSYGLVYAGNRNPYTPTHYVRNPRVYWQFDNSKD